MVNRVSLCVIAKNEEATLPACLRSAADLVHEIIVIDTGSTDRTKEVAASFGARVFDFAWCDDFAAARNEAGELENDSEQELARSRRMTR